MSIGSPYQWYQIHVAPTHEAQQMCGTMCNAECHYKVFQLRCEQTSTFKKLFLFIITFPHCESGGLDPNSPRRHFGCVAILLLSISSHLCIPCSFWTYLCCGLSLLGFSEECDFRSLLSQILFYIFYTFYVCCLGV